MNKTPIDHDQREKIRLDLRDSLVVEAGAGTGKTSLLIERLRSLIKELKVTELAAITFTEKAAGELRDRFRRKLEENIIDKHTGKRNPEVLAALDDLDRAQISTIHGFATSIIREHPFEADLEPDFQHIDDEEEFDLLLKILSDSLSVPDAERDQLIALFLMLRGSFNQLKELLVLLNKERELLPYFVPSTNIEDASSWFTGFRERVMELEEDARRYCTNPDEDGCYQQTLKISAAMPSETGAGDEDTWMWLGDLTGINTTAGNQDNWIDADRCREQKKALKELKAEATIILEAAKTAVLEKLIQWLRDVIAQVDEIKRENGWLTFQDQLIIANELLKNPDISTHLHNCYKRLLIDEFQDTDPLQVEIAMRLAAAKPVIDDVEECRLESGRIFLVGDPKQSIYRFRRADHRIYNHASEMVSRQGSKVIISQNFRSAPGIIEFVNKFFEPIWEAESGDGAKYERLAADPDRSDPEHSPVMLIRRSESAEPAEKIGQVRKVEADAIAKVIDIAVNREKWRTWLREADTGFRSSEVNYGDMAVLFPVMTDIDIYTNVLADAGIPHNIEKGKGFYLRQIVRDLYNCLAAIDNPADRLAVTGALRSSFFGLSDVELFEWRNLTDGRMDYREKLDNTPDAVEAALVILRRLHSERRTLPADRIIERLLELTDIIPALLSDRYAAIDVGAIENVLALARRYEADSRNGLRGFRRMLWGRIEGGVKEDVSPPSGQVDYVRLMTVHAAKGLEFPVVILANLSPVRSDTEKLIPDRRGKRFDVRIGSAGDGFRTAGFQEAAESEKAAGRAESLRLLYVAMTRARDHLVIPNIFSGDPTGYNKWLHEMISGTGSFEGQPLPQFRLCTTDELPAVSTVISERRRSKIDVEEAWKAKESWLSERAVRLERSRERLPKIVQPSRHEPRQTGMTQSSDEPTGTSDAVSLGRALHRYMALTEPVTTLDEALSEHISAQENVSGDELDSLIRNCLECEIWRKAIAGKRLWREVPVRIRTTEGMMHGIIDLVWEDAEDNIHIVDWKSGAFDPDRHREQIRDYTRSLKQASGKDVASANLFFAGECRQIRFQF